jgi:alpha-ketoglutarate-dependent taurine dioxygenase
MLLLSPNLAQQISLAVHPLLDGPILTREAADRLKNSASVNDSLRLIASLATAILDEQGYVQIRGLPTSSTKQSFLAIGSLLGTIFIDPAESSAVINAHVKPSEMLMGNQLRHLPFHTDYSMLREPPRLTMSLCLDPDPMPGWGAIQVADIEAMIFGVESDPDVHRFFSVPFPFAARREQNDVSLIESPIIVKESHSEHILVRYHRSRIRQGFFAQKMEPTPEQTATMLAFERHAAEHTYAMHPEVGDITVIDNHRMVHARTCCSIVVDADGTTRGRRMQFLFAY